MGVPVKIPSVGESINEVTIGSWTKKDGESVQMDEVIAELESDKATFELTAPQAGVLKIMKQEGASVSIGELVCEIEPNGEAGKKNDSVPLEAKEKVTPAKENKAKATGEIKEMRVPAVGESITEVTLSAWMKKDGDYIQMDEIIAEVESDKATFDLPAEAPGVLHIVAKEGETLPVGGLICTIEVVEGSPQTQREQTEAPANSTAEKDQSYAKGHPSPAAAKILDEKGIPADQIKGSGKAGRITKDDAVKARPAEKTEAISAAPVSSGPAPIGERAEHSEKMSSLRKTIARRLVAVKNETAMLTTFNEVDMKPIMDMRSRYKEKFKEKYGVGLGFMSFFTKAVCQALQEWPSVNAQINGDEILYHDFCDVSIAVSTPKGLVVPVIRNAESLSFNQIESEVARLAARGRDGKLSIDEMQGGTFSITNGGVFGSMLSTPILNPPQSAILGMHNIVERPVVRNGEIVIRPIMFVALSYDHRIVDGRESVSFLFRVKELLEDPGRLILGV
jgi:2-oxoglutarate dehydrogenase E2 component (dihydrolipoamide succinyltransferase)